MSSSDRAAAPLLRIAALTAALAALAGVAGCTVQPLYGEATSAIGVQGPAGPASERLASIEVKPATDRVGQEVRNHLVFLLGGGRGQPANPAYQLALDTTASRSRAATVETRSALLEPTSGIVTLRGRYTLTEARTGRVVSAGLRSVQAPYDIPTQEYAALRAERDAQNRAARELAELLRLVIAQELEKATSLSAPAVVVTPEEIEDADTRRDPAGI